MFKTTFSNVVIYSGQCVSLHLGTSQAFHFNCMKETNKSDKDNTLRNPNYREEDQLIIYKHNRGISRPATPAEWSVRDLNLRPPDFKSGSLITRPHCLPSLLDVELTTYSSSAPTQTEMSSGSHKRDQTWKTEASLWAQGEHRR